MDRSKLQIAMALILALNSCLAFGAPNDDDGVVTSEGARKKQISLTYREIDRLEAELQNIQAKIESLGETARVDAPYTTASWTGALASPDADISKYLLARFTNTSFQSSASPTQVLLMVPANGDEQGMINRINSDGTANAQWQCVRDSLTSLRALRREQDRNMSSEQQLVRLISQINNYNEGILALQKALRVLEVYSDENFATAAQRIGALNDWRLKKSIWLAVTDTQYLYRQCQSPSFGLTLLAATKLLQFNVAQPTALLDWNKKVSPQTRAQLDAELTKAQRALFRASMSLNLVQGRYAADLKKITDKLNSMPRPGERMKEITRPEYAGRLKDVYPWMEAVEVLGVVAVVTPSLMFTKGTALGWTIRLGGIAAGFAGMIYMSALSQTPVLKDKTTQEDQAYAHLKELKEFAKTNAEFKATTLQLAADWAEIFQLGPAGTLRLAEAIQDRIASQLAKLTEYDKATVDRVWNGEFNLSIDVLSLLEELSLVPVSQLQSLKTMNERGTQVGAQLAANTTVRIEDSVSLNIFVLKGLIKFYEEAANEATGDLATELNGRIANLKRAVRHAEQTLALAQNYMN